MNHPLTPEDHYCEEAGRTLAARGGGVIIASGPQGVVVLYDDGTFGFHTHTATPCRPPPVGTRQGRREMRTRTEVTRSVTLTGPEVGDLIREKMASIPSIPGAALIPSKARAELLVRNPEILEVVFTWTDETDDQAETLDVRAYRWGAAPGPTRKESP